MWSIVVVSLVVCSVFGRRDEFPLRICQSTDGICWNLAHIAVVHRHTIRSPTKFPDHDRYLTPDLYPRGEGASTILGLQYAHTVGILWRHWWRPHFLTGNPDEVYARVSARARCYETTQAILFELFSPGPCHRSQQFCLPYDPVSIVRPPDGFDKNADYCISRSKYLLAVTMWNLPFKRFNVMKREIPKSVSSRFKTLEDFIAYAKQQSGLQHMNNMDFFTQQLDAYISNKWENYPIPKWIMDVWPVWVYAADTIYSVAMSYVKTAAGTGVTKDVIKMLRSVTDPSKNSKKKLSLFGYHDSTISSIRAALNSSYSTGLPRPDYLSALFFELYRNDNGTQFAIRIRQSPGISYDGRYQPLELLKTDKCETEFCPAESVFSSLENFFTEDNCPNKNVV